MKWEKAQIIDEINSIQQENLEQKVKIRVISDRQPKLNRKIQRETLKRDKYLEEIEGLSNLIQEEQGRKNTLEKKYFKPLLKGLSTRTEELLIRISYEREEISRVRDRVQQISALVREKENEFEDCIVEATDIQHNLKQDTCKFGF